MVDATDAGLDLVLVVLVREIKGLEEAPDACLHGVAEADGADGRVTEHKAGQGAHGVGVVQEPHIGTDFGHVFGEALHGIAAAEGTEKPADAEGVRDGLTQAVLRRDGEINGLGDGEVPDADGVDGKVSAAQGLLAVFNAAVSGDGCAVLVDILVESAQHHLRFTETLGIDVVEGDVGVLQSRSTKGVADDVLDEDRTAGAHERNFSH